MPTGQPLTAAWLWDDSAGAFVDNTVEAQTDGGTAFELLGDTSDFFYFGFARRFDALMYVLGTAGSYGALTWEYSVTGDSWARFVPVRDGEFETTPSFMLWDHRGSTVDDDWVTFSFSNGTPHAATPPDTTSRFWIRVSAASVTTAAKANSVVCRPYVTYATATDVQRQLQISQAFSTTSTPSLATVEDFIRGAEDTLVYQMGEAWRVEFEENELLNFNQYGMKSRWEPIIEVYDLAVWNGSGFDSKNEGRDEDWHFIPRTGMLYVSTIFLDAVPPKFRRSYSARRDQGAFKYAVRITYSHGHDIRRSKLGVQLSRIATKQACIDIVTDLDFSPLVPLGLDTVNLQTKVDNWTKEVNDFLTRYSKLRLY